MSSMSVLVVDDELDIRELISEILSEEGYDVTVASSASEANRKRSKKEFDLILLDIWMPETDGISLLKQWSEEENLNSEVVMMSGHGTVDTAIESTHLGASNFVEKPLSIAKLLRTVEGALTERKKKTNPKRSIDNASFVSIGHSDLLKDFRKELSRVAKVDSSILIIGEDGTGREAYANYVHNISDRSMNNCITLDSSSLSEEVLKDEILGSGKSEKITLGIIDKLQNGTLILKNLAEFNLNAQLIINNILETNIFNINGGKEKIQCNFRTIAIVNENYLNQVREGRLKRELISNLNIQTIKVPPLREHAEDIPDFIKFYTDQLSEAQELTYRRFTVAAQNRLRNFPWPGNHIELKNIIERLLVKGITDDVTLDETEEELKKEIDKDPVESLIKQDLLSLPLKEAREQFEKAYLQQQLILCDGKVGKLAKRVGVERTHLYRKLKSLQIDIKTKDNP
ncbi:MAG: sigma-54-dependent Fis family transcriptional regulator [Gammaproteobacteria bacterium]|nr:MAG: sigma-54-dependent Fis family transcriptional regulator [Gammaproteobacteria bacterium]|tara:strand:+ start:267 stop:1637 length:1371 start_codon:yes stop_codon:yes gene_type:complete